MKAQCLPFSQIPHTTELFTDFLAYAPKVRPFYPHSPYIQEWIKTEAANLRYDSGRRERMGGILERQNKIWDASPQTLANIERLRKGAAAIVTGQQVGLFGGPMFAIYKALSAVKLAEEAAAAGIDAVPVFWLATYDHDLAEVNHAAIPGSDFILRMLATSSHGVSGAPVSDVRLGDEIVPLVDEAAALLGESEATALLRETYRPGETLGSAFARLYARLFAEWGVILLDASDAELHRLAAPVYRAAVERAEELTSGLISRGQALETAGYYQQVKVTNSSVLLFTLRDGARTAIHKKSAGANSATEFVIGADAGAEKLLSAALLARIEAAPENFSPNVLLRPVVQDYVLPTLAYAGGAAEAAYFAQAGAVYELLLGRVTPIVPRFSATLVEPKVQRWLAQYGISVRDVFQGGDALKRLLGSKALPEGVHQAFEAAQRSVQNSLAHLRGSLEKLDPTLAAAGETAESKMNYQLERLQQLATAAELRRSEVVNRHAAGLSAALYPEGALQERSVAGIYFMARQGMELLRDIYGFMRSDCHDHQVIDV
ncbi:MAG TPA: bacillithiol biosynthesis cysteine-adding enzyme BshC [Candidatus Binatia bacterium]|nr:bacillithiol biosynthesis cysteine-adding enzyme BshC [Candidatus Binatia bacterium]